MVGGENRSWQLMEPSEEKADTGWTRVKESEQMEARPKLVLIALPVCFQGCCGHLWRDLGSSSWAGRLAQA